MSARDTARIVAATAGLDNLKKVLDHLASLEETGEKEDLSQMSARVARWRAIVLNSATLLGQTRYAEENSPRGESLRRALDSLREIYGAPEPAMFCERFHERYDQILSECWEAAPA